MKEKKNLCISCKTLSFGQIEMIFFFFKDVYILYREAQYGQIKGSQKQKKKKMEWVFYKKEKGIWSI